MVVTIALAGLAAAWAFAEHEHMHHAGMMMKTAKGVKIELQNDTAAKILTMRLGPLNLPPQISHHAAAQAPDQFFTIPFDGWLTAYHPRLTDDAAQALPGRLLHHVAFYNTRRSDFLCAAKPEHIFGAGSEMSDWLAVPDVGYRVRKGDRIRVSTMFHNPTDTNYPKAYLEVKMEYQPAAAGGSALKNVYPAWFDVKECGDSSYDLKPGKNVTSGEFKLGYSGRLVGVGGHLHDYGHKLQLEDMSRMDTLATLDAKLDPQGRLLSIPVVLFTDRGGYPLSQGQALKVTATYDNPTGKFLPESAMGIVVGYFLPNDDSQMAHLRRK